MKQKHNLNIFVNTLLISWFDIEWGWIVFIAWDIGNFLHFPHFLGRKEAKLVIKFTRVISFSHGYLELGLCFLCTNWEASLVFRLFSNYVYA